MSNLFATLQSSCSALDVFQKALSVTSNNVANASTPGYARQTLGLQAQPFNLDWGLGGGVASTGVESARDVYAERAVQTQQTALGTSQQLATTLSTLQASFDVTGTTGIPGALTKLFSAFSSWSSSPTDVTARQTVMSAAQSVADQFQQQSNVLDQAASNADTQLKGLVDQVNNLASTIRQNNVKREAAGGQDPAVEANLYNAVEQLSKLVPVQTLQAADGSTTVLLAGQVPLVVGSYQYEISSTTGIPATPPATNPSGAPSAEILDSSGKDVTSLITQGQIGGLLEARNGIIASLRGDSQQQGQLNVLAQNVADDINQLFESGNISDAVPATGSTPAVPAVTGLPLFTYDASRPSDIAGSFSVSTAITANKLAAIDPGPPEVNNGIALKLAKLATQQSSAAGMNNLSYSEYFGKMASVVGTALSNAQSDQTTQQELVTQTQDLRQQSSGVSLDTEAIQVLQFQRSYQAISKLVTILDNLTQTVVNMIQ